MRTILFSLLMLAAVPLAAQQPTPAAKVPPCGCQTATTAKLPLQDRVDATEAIVAGFGERAVFGRFRPITLATRLHRDELMAGKVDGFKDTLGRVLPGAPSPQRQCMIATYAVLGLQLANAFGANIPPEAIAAAVMLQQQLCSQVQAVPTDGKTPTPARQTGLKLPPENVLKARHATDKLKHAAQYRMMAEKAAEPLPATYSCSQYCLPVDNQGACGTCWDDSGLRVIAAANVKAGYLTTAGSSALSRQFILNQCGPPNGGCNGDDGTTILRWCQQGGGVPLESLLPYVARQQRCTFTQTATGYTVSDWGYCDTITGVPDTKKVKAAMLQYGPILVCIAADGSFINGYHGGVFRGRAGGINHQVYINGWTDDATIPEGGYWHLVNSWGEGWGENGLCRIAYGANLVGTEAVWAVAGKPIVLNPTPGPTPDPVPPQPDPTPRPPTRRMTTLLKDIDAITAKYQSGSEADKAQVLKLLDTAEREVKASKAALGIAN